MDEARASWNTVYQSECGFECQITLRDEDEKELIQRASKVMTGVIKSGGYPVKRKNSEIGNAVAEEKGEKPEKTYVDEKGVRRCNLKLKSGKVCGHQVTEKQGRYGPFWSCPNYKEHAA